MSKTLKFGIIGFSEGNGHPYSWSALFNGYHESMKECHFPVIVQYLSTMNFPADAIQGAAVEYIWTQDSTLTQKIARAANINHVVERIEDMLSHVDAVLLARDDAENHYDFAKPIIEAGLPIFVDKPFAYCRKEAQRIAHLEKYKSQIFSCSALTYSPEILDILNNMTVFGKIKKIRAETIKDWPKYSIHIIEPVLKLLQGSSVIITNVNHDGLKTQVQAIDETGVEISFMANGQKSGDISIEIEFETGTKIIRFDNYADAFKNSLQEFVRIVKKQTHFDITHLFPVIGVIEAGLLNYMDNK